MIGDLIKPDPRGNRRRVRLYRVPFYKRRWLRWGLYGALVSILVGCIGALLFLKPYRDRALTFDLDEMHELEQASIIYDRHRQEIGRIFVLNRQPVTFDKIPFHMIQALVATEDSRFFTHAGVDFMGILRAVWKNLKPGGYTQGASTITQQLARKSFDLRGKTLDRKLTEAFVAHRIEQHYSKNEILELYLNHIYFGSSFYGIEAACRGYFGKPASEIGIAEAAVLCGLVKSPNRLSPLNSPELARQERNYVLERMRTEKMISDEDCARLVASPLVLDPQPVRQNSSYEEAYIRQKVIDRLGFETVSNGGFRIYTTIDRGIQEAAVESLRRNLEKVETGQRGYTHQTFAEYDRIHQAARAAQREKEIDPPEYLQGAALVIDNRTGGIVTLVGGRDFDHSEFNRAIQARRPAGTAFKPVVYAAAFEKGAFPGTQLADSPIDNRNVMMGGTTGILGEWGIETEGNVWKRDISARRALVEGKNAATARLGMDVGIEAVSDAARRMGVESPLREYPSTFLGASEVKLSEMCLAFSTFPNGGVRPATLHIIAAIHDSSGRPVYEWDAGREEPVPALDPIAAYQVHSCLAQVLDEGTGALARTEYGLEDFPAGGKTGTHYGFTDLMFVGYDSALTCGVWAGFDDFQQSIHEGAFSNRIVLPVWVDVMNASLNSFPPQPIPAPEANGAEWIEICQVSGQRATDGCYEEAAGPEGRTILRRCTFNELVREGTRISVFCDVHSEGRGQSGDLDTILSSVPRLPTLTESEDAEPVVMVAPTVVGDDPYGAVQPALRPQVVGQEDGPTRAPRALVVYPTKLGSDKARIELEPPSPMQFE